MGGFDDLRGNPLAHLPASLTMLPRLEKLDLQWVETLAHPSGSWTSRRRGCAIYR